MSLKYKYLSLLFVEDDEDVYSEAVEYLEGIFGKVLHAPDGKSGLEAYEDFRPDIVITDLKMPHMDGLELARKIKAINDSVPIYVTTAFTTEEGLIEGIEIGLTGWLKKPFMHTSLIEELDKIYAYFFKSENIRISENLIYNSIQHHITIDGNVLSLTRKENELLTLLVKNSNKIVTYEMVAYGIYRDNFMSENALRVLVKSLRHKIPSLPLKNIFGIGYKLVISET